MLFFFKHVFANSVIILLECNLILITPIISNIYKFENKKSNGWVIK